MNNRTTFLRRDLSDFDPDPVHDKCGAERILIGAADEAAAEVFHVGVADAKLHHHDRTAEIYYVLDGQGKMIVGEDEVELRPGVVVYVPQGLRHKAVGDNLTALVVCIPRGVLDDFHVDE